MANGSSINFIDAPGLIKIERTSASAFGMEVWCHLLSRFLGKKNENVIFTSGAHSIDYDSHDLPSVNLPEFGDIHLLLYADDIAIIGESRMNLQKKIKILKEYIDENLMTLNESKSKIMVFRNGGPVKKYVERELGKKKDIITMEAKREMIEKHERGMRVTEIARFYKKSTSTICTILKKKKELSELDAAKGVTRLSKQRPRLLEEVEKLILVWINEKQLAGDTITQNLICEKAKALYAELGSKIPCTSIENEVHADFKASKGWFENFKRRSGIHSVTRHGEGASSDAKAAETFTAEFEKLVVT
ncbi:hypothetical protein LAZ67_13001921 [Cordylochernes scorpioides]|uniref:HTH CENPB-type domain-containing protein n=1 Tax=Cordylochernes scorpioides TaxID=51811 RepID=A0ABY6L482_9ARAC|nr:hypothetical protein LAZ67_13001921 [Cordylochernes scorpioides]